MDHVDTEYSGLGRRIAAHFVDVVICLSILVLHGVTFRILRAAGIWEPTELGPVTPAELWQSFGVAPQIAIIVAFVVVSGLIYFPVFESSAWQATPGKRMLNLYVTRDDRRCLPSGRAAGRWLVKWFLGIFGGSVISLGMIGGLQNQKAIHDFAAGTILLRGRPAGAIEVWRVLAAFVVPFVWLVVTFYTIL